MEVEVPQGFSSFGREYFLGLDHSLQWFRYHHEPLDSLKVTSGWEKFVYYTTSTEARTHMSPRPRLQKYEMFCFSEKSYEENNPDVLLLALIFE